MTSLDADPAPHRGILEMMKLVAAMFGVLLAVDAGAADGTMCLSDGQVIGGQLELHPRHLAIGIDGLELRVPLATVPEDCPEFVFRGPYSHPLTLRTLTLSDGQRLHGSPLYVGLDVQLRLLDGSMVYLPQPMVEDVDRLSAGRLEAQDAWRDALRADRKGKRARAAVGLVSVATLVAVPVALYGSETLFGLRYGRHPYDVHGATVR